MKRPILMLALACVLWGAVSGPAAADVEDQAGLLSPAQHQQLDRALGQISGHRFDVVVVDHASGSATSLARQVFRQHHLGSYDGVIAVSTRDHKIGVEVGRGLNQAGVNAGAIHRMIARDFTPRARQHDVAGGLSSLAQDMGNTADAGQTTRAGGYDSQPIAPPHHGHGLLFFLIFVAAIGGGIWWYTQKKQGSGLLERFATLREQQGRMANQTLKLDGIEDLGKYHEGTTAQAFEKLAARTQPLLENFKLFADTLDKGETAAKAGKFAIARKALDWLEARGDQLESEIAATVTAMNTLDDSGRRVNDLLNSAQRRIEDARAVGLGADQLPALEAKLSRASLTAKRNDPRAVATLAEELTADLDRLEGRLVTQSAALSPESLPAAAQAAARELNDLKSRLAQLELRDRALGGRHDAGVKARMYDAQQALTVTPVDLPKAQHLIAEIGQATNEYAAMIEREVERQDEINRMHVMLDSQRPLVFVSGGGYGGPVYVEENYAYNSNQVWDDPLAGGASSESSWGSDSGSSWDSSGDSSWGSSDSSDSSWSDSSSSDSSW